MKKIFIIAQTLDLIIDLTLKIVGMWFLWSQEWISGAIMLGASGVYSISMYFGHKMRKDITE